MGQTLSHGVYLPNEGERNCYAGLASNWQILNTAVGNIAEKAPLVHTHGNISNDGKVGTTANLPLITGTGGVVQAGSFGNAANTFCEGNDSRLSDARTPVAHTHGKADITDLLNSNFIPSANNTYDLGSSSYQWNNLYAKNYYYNGTAWGLDKYNQWTEVNDFNNLIGLNGAELWFKNSNIDDFTANPSADTGKSIVQIWNKGTTQYCGGIIDGLDTSGTHVFEIVNFGYPLNSTNAYQHRFRFASKRDGTASFYPTYPNVDLGTSTNKWKTLNGINPGALSLPDTLGTSGTENVNYFNVIGYLNNTGTLATIPATATYDGWLYINAKDGADSYITVDDYPSGFGTSVFGNNGLGSSSVGLLCLICPIRKGHAYNVRIKTDGIVSARIYPAQGNV